MITKAFLNETHSSHPMFKVYEVDMDGVKASEFDRKTGEKVEKKPIVSMGMKKAKALLDNLPALEAFVAEGS